MITTGIDLLIERRRRDLTQWELAKLSNVSPDRISAAEHNRRQLTPDETLRMKAALESIPPERG